uniref:Uncharacterized protein n=1 Tax=Oryza glumipatula TaxID=40148 RepID=A0A0E0AHE0_9ORYZ
MEVMVAASSSDAPPAQAPALLVHIETDMHGWECGTLAQYQGGLGTAPDPMREKPGPDGGDLPPPLPPRALPAAPSPTASDCSCAVPHHERRRPPWLPTAGSDSDNDFPWASTGISDMKQIVHSCHHGPSEGAKYILENHLRCLTKPSMPPYLQITTSGIIARAEYKCIAMYRPQRSLLFSPTLPDPNI